MLRLQANRKKMKAPQRRMGHFPLLLLLLVGLVNNSFGGGPASSTSYVVGEAEKQGTSVIESVSVSSTIICAAKCSLSPGCLGFNWISLQSSSNNCETLSSLREVDSQKGSNLCHWPFYPSPPLPLSALNTDMKAVKLRHESSNTYKLEPPDATTPYWTHSCYRNGVVVGVASLTDLTDLDFLLCMNFRGMVIGYDSLEGFTVVDGSRNCTYFSQNHLVEAVWSKDEKYSDPSEFRYVCRKILTPGMDVDHDRCTDAQKSVGLVPKESGQYQILRCPPHMAAVSIQRLYNGSARVLCCLIY
ncbi:uncharacterized protein LOC135200628 [Macrobrachium nipponense]|uniref:uncharacterized protein LOC135200628 n=1 Tax=Macrobrachium nipponense TaxID=159736 RepID=UPI0030C8C97E